MSDLGTYLDYGSAEISDDLNPRWTRQPGKQEPSNERKKMLADTLSTSLEHGRRLAVNEGLYPHEGDWARADIPDDDIIVGANDWLLENTGLGYDEFVGHMGSVDLSNAVEWAWSLQGEPTVQWNAASMLRQGNMWQVALDEGVRFAGAAGSLLKGDLGGARDAWTEKDGYMYGYDPNPYGGQIGNALGVHNWADAGFALLDLADIASFGLGGEIIRPMRWAAANAQARLGNHEAARIIGGKRLREEFAERAARANAAWPGGPALYHGGGQDLSAFTGLDPARGRSLDGRSAMGDGLYTTPDVQFASGYADAPNQEAIKHAEFFGDPRPTPVPGFVHSVRFTGEGAPRLLDYGAVGVADDAKQTVLETLSKMDDLLGIPFHEPLGVPGTILWTDAELAPLLSKLDNPRATFADIHGFAEGSVTGAPASSLRGFVERVVRNNTPDSALWNEKVSAVMDHLRIGLRDAGYHGYVAPKGGGFHTGQQEFHGEAAEPFGDAIAWFAPERDLTIMKSTRTGMPEQQGPPGTDPVVDRDYDQYLKDNPDYAEGETRGLMAAEARWDDPTLDPDAIWRAGDELEGPPLGEYQPLEGPPGTPQATTYYHGTSADFEDFDYGGDLLEPGTWGRNTPNADSGLGFHFSTSPESAEFIGPNIMERRLRLENPLEVDEVFGAQDLRIRAYISELGLDDLYEESHRAWRVKEGLPPISDAADPASRLLADTYERTFLSNWRQEAVRTQNRRIMQRDHPSQPPMNEYNSESMVPNLDSLTDEQHELYSELMGGEVAGNIYGVGTSGDEITREWIQSFGYDGLHIREAFMGPSRAPDGTSVYREGLPEQASWVVFDPDQISKLQGPPGTPDLFAEPSHLPPPAEPGPSYRSEFGEYPADWDHLLTPEELEARLAAERGGYDGDGNPLWQAEARAEGPYREDGPPEPPEGRRHTFLYPEDEVPELTDLEGWTRLWDRMNIAEQREVGNAYRAAHPDEVYQGEPPANMLRWYEQQGSPGIPDLRPLPENLGEPIRGGGEGGTVYDPGPDRVLDTYQDIDIYEILDERGIDVPENMTHMDALAILGDDYPFWNQFHQGASPGAVDYDPVFQYRARMRELHEGESTFGAGGFDVDPPGTPERHPLDRDPSAAQREPFPETFTPDEIDQIVRNEGGLTDKEIRDLMGDTPNE